MYKSVVIEYSPKANDMAKKIEDRANEMSQEGYELVTMSITGSAKAILVFKEKNKFSRKKINDNQKNTMDRVNFIFYYFKLNHAFRCRFSSTNWLFMDNFYISCFKYITIFLYRITIKKQQFFKNIF